MSEVDSIILSSPEETQERGAGWALECQPGDVIALHGVLGSGKTQLVKGLVRALGYEGEVTSPTFTILHEYQGGRLPVYHLDLYRLETLEDARRVGVEDYLFGDGVTVVEWPEQIEALLPPHTKHYTIEVVSLNERLIKTGCAGPILADQ